MDKFILFATPFWVNLLILIPFLLFYSWKNNKLKISGNTLIYTAIFGIAFGFIESACVIYLRASTGLLPGFHGTLFDIQRLSTEPYSQEILRKSLPMSLLTTEIIREAATIIMLISIAFITTKNLRERFAIFIWTFAFWDIFYYVWLFWTIRWPQSPTTTDVLFLIPKPWFSQVWFPILISSLTIIAVFVNSKYKKSKTND